MALEELETKVIELRDARDWAQYHNPKNLTISLSLEATEMLKIFQWKDQEEMKVLRADPEGRRRVKEKRGDILIYARIKIDKWEKERP
jgi:NTP pyrophosphatase (non-canonical NTP hydrolase)